ncbi:MAG: hypothetical protein ACJ0SL_05580 [Candidatus Rariloculaceae bacterium]
MGRGGGGGREEPQFPNVEKETMIFQIPDKWYPYHRTTDEMIDTYIFPTGDEPSDWEETLRQEVFLTTAGVTEPRQVYDLRYESNRGSCDELESEILHDSLENGYPMFSWKQVCQLPDGVLSSLNKVVLGLEQLYILSKVWKSEPRDREWERWEEYFDRVYVCDPTRPGHRCRPIRQGAQQGRGR